MWLTEVQVWNAPGQSTATQRFDAWGTLELAAGSVPTYGYTGREPDATGLIHYRARYYHPELGRFVSRDPLGLSAGINPYAYADGNPVLFNDPDGLMAALAWNSANQYFNDYQVGTRVQGALQFGAGLGMGALGTGVGVTTGWTGLGAVGGGALIALGSDQMSGKRPTATAFLSLIQRAMIARTWAPQCCVHKGDHGHKSPHWTCVQARPVQASSGRVQARCGRGVVCARRVGIACGARS